MLTKAIDGICEDNMFDRYCERNMLTIGRPDEKSNEKEVQS